MLKVILSSTYLILKNAEGRTAKHVGPTLRQLTTENPCHKQDVRNLKQIFRHTENKRNYIRYFNSCKPSSQTITP